jgi:hypothetical protein
VYIESFVAPYLTLPLPIAAVFRPSRRALEGTMAESTNKVAAVASEKVESINSASAASPTFHGERDLDDAFEYLHTHTDAESDAVNLPALRRKIDWHIIPIMFACYVLQFVDKVVINVSVFFLATFNTDISH